MNRDLYLLTVFIFIVMPFGFLCYQLYKNDLPEFVEQFDTVPNSETVEIKQVEISDITVIQTFSTKELRISCV